MFLCCIRSENSLRQKPDVLLACVGDCYLAGSASWREEGLHMLTLPPHFRSRRREQHQEKAIKSLECPWLEVSGCNCERVTPSKEIVFQNSKTFDVARPGLPESNY